MKNMNLFAMYSKSVLIENKCDLTEAIIIFSEDKGIIQEIIEFYHDNINKMEAQNYYKKNYNFLDYSEYVIFPGVTFIFNIIAYRLPCLYSLWLI